MICYNILLPHSEKKDLKPTDVFSFDWDVKSDDLEEERKPSKAEEIKKFFDKINEKCQ